MFLASNPLVVSASGEKEILHAVYTYSTHHRLLAQRLRYSVRHHGVQFCASTAQCFALPTKHCDLIASSE